MKKVISFIIVLLVMAIPLVSINAGVTDNSNIVRKTTTNYFTTVSFKGEVTLKDGSKETFDKQSSEITGNYSDKAVTNEVSKLKSEFIKWAKDKGAIVFSAGKEGVTDYYYDAHDEITQSSDVVIVGDPEEINNSQQNSGQVTINTILDKHQTYVVNYTAKVEDLKFTKGANGKFTLDTKNNLSFTLNSDYSLFKNSGKVYVNDTVLSTKNYSSKSGSTIITLKNAYLNTLTDGSYTIKVELSNGLTAKTNFNIISTKAAEPEPVVEPEPEATKEEPKKEEIKEEKKEEKKSSIWLYIGICCGVLIFVGIIVYIIKSKKEK